MSSSCTRLVRMATAGTMKRFSVGVGGDVASSSSSSSRLLLRSISSWHRLSRASTGNLVLTRNNNNNYIMGVSAASPSCHHHRWYSVSTPRLNSDDDDNNNNNNNTENDTEPRFLVLNNSMNLTDDEIEKLFEEEELKMKEEEEERFVPNWKPGMRKRPVEMSYVLEDFLYEIDPENYPVRPWSLRDKRCGALAIKVGMMPVYDDVKWGERFVCTVLYLDNNVVLGHKTQEKHGYNAVQVAAGQRKRKNVGKCVLGQYKQILQYDPDEHPPYLVREFRISDPAHFIPPLTTIHARHFVPGQNIDVSGISKGKGFQGGMKRHNFGGMPASHGVSRSHRAIGSTGQCQDPGRVFKGKKMPGHMGVERVTTQNLRIIKIDRGRNLLYVQGSVPGNYGHFVEIRDAVKKPLWRTDKVLDSLERPPLPTFDFDPSIDGCGEPGHEEWMPMPPVDPLLPDALEQAA